MLQYSYGNIIVANIIILEFLSARFVHPGALQLTILSFFNMSYEDVRITKANKHLNLTFLKVTSAKKR